MIKRMMVACLLLAGCGHYGYHTAAVERTSVSPEYELLSRVYSSACDFNDSFNESLMVKKVQYKILSAAGGDGLLNCVWSIEPNVESQSCVKMSCRPYILTNHSSKSDQALSGSLLDEDKQ